METAQPQPRDTGTGERMADLARAKTSAITHKLQGEEQDQTGARFVVEAAEAERLTEDWPAAPRKIARQMIERYGAPNEATPVRLVWHRNRPWKRTQVARDEIVHNFPTSHTDFLTQWIDYSVPPRRFSDIAEFDGSCLADRTAGEAAARCDSEAMNILTLNLMHEIVTGSRAVDEARQVYAENAAAFTMGQDAPYAERLLFDVPEGGAVDPDEKVIGEAMAQKAKEAVTSDGSA
ncbi:MAG TPA: hypothetical protein VG709_07770 [Actinomycetota bacterium]|nr:hypothetical protein [Actinomycetota bacterium]